MNFKLIHIKYRFYIQISLFVVYLALVVSVILILNNKSKMSASVSEQINDLQITVDEIELDYLSFLYHLNPASSFYINGKDEYTKSFSKALTELEDSLQHLEEENRFAQRLANEGWHDSLSTQMQNIGLSFRNTTYALQELGNADRGKISEVYQAREELQIFLSQFDDNDFSGLINPIVVQELEFILGKNNAVLNDLIMKADDISYHSAFEEVDFMISDELSNHITNYKNRLNQVKATRIRIEDKQSSKGSVFELAEGYLQLQATFKNYIGASQKLLDKLRRRSVLIGAFICILFTLIYLFLLTRLFLQLNKPLKSLIDYSFKLSKGRQDIVPVNKDIPHEFSEIGSNLQGVFDAIKGKKTFADNLLKQNFSSEITLQGKHDTFGQTLIALREQMRKSRDEQMRYVDENKIRRYQNEGLAHFSEILRTNSSDIYVLADNFVKEAVRYLESIQGGLFLLEDDKAEELQLYAAFAFNRKKYLTKSIKKGESLIGTCAVEKKTINLTKLPPEYIEITSGLGDAPPSNLLLVPIMHDKQLIGVMEVASLKAFDENQITLAEKICDSLASTIINARANSRTTDLLQKSQQQAAEMAEQEEEMRQNMEELQATQEESGRREEELEGFLSAIDQAFYVLEYDTEGVIIKVNQRFLYLVDLPIDKVLGKKHEQLFGKRSKADSRFFANISEGNVVELTELIEINKKKLEIKNTFSPEKSKSGETIKVLNIMNVIL